MKKLMTQCLNKVKIAKIKYKQEKLIKFHHQDYLKKENKLNQRRKLYFLISLF